MRVICGIFQCKSEEVGFVYSLEQIKITKLYITFIYTYKINISKLNIYTWFSHILRENVLLSKNVEKFEL